LVGVQITSNLTLEELFQRQVDPQLQTTESPAAGRLHAVARGFHAREGRARRRRRGPQAVRRAGIADASRYPRDATEHDRRTATDADLARPLPVDRGRRVDSGERRVFDRSSDVDLVDAVTASGAVWIK
jgi:NTE family protein